MEARKWAMRDHGWEVQHPEEEAALCAAHLQHKATQAAAAGGDPATEVILLSGAPHVIADPVRFK